MNDQSLTWIELAQALFSILIIAGDLALCWWMFT